MYRGTAGHRAGTPRPPTLRMLYTSTKTVINGTPWEVQRRRRCALKGLVWLYEERGFFLKEKPQKKCVVGLTAEPERLIDVRKNRMTSLNEKHGINYTNLETIKNEVEEAKKTFKKYKWPTIDVTRKSVEETAASIIKIYDILKSKNEK